MDNFFEHLSSFVKTGDNSNMRQYLGDPKDARKLTIFRNTFLTSCIDTLKRKYLSCVQALGEEYFHQLARAYVDQNPPKSKVLAEYGSTFPCFLAEHLQKGSLDYVSDLAALDKAWHQVYFSKDTVEASQEDIARWMKNIESISLLLSTNAALVQTSWTISGVWVALKSSALANHMEIQPTQESVLLWRDEQGIVSHRLLTLGESEFVSAIQAGRTLPDAAELAMNIEETDISSVFSQLITNNIITERK